MPPCKLRGEIITPSRDSRLATGVSRGRRQAVCARAPRRAGGGRERLQGGLPLPARWWASTRRGAPGSPCGPSWEPRPTRGPQVATAWEGPRRWNGSQCWNVKQAVSCCCFIEGGRWGDVGRQAQALRGGRVQGWHALQVWAQVWHRCEPQGRATRCGTPPPLGPAQQREGPGGEG